MRPDCIDGFGPVGTNGPAESVGSVLAEMRAELDSRVRIQGHESRHEKVMRAMADRLAAAHERDAAALAASEARVALLESDAERIASCPWRVQKGCTALCQPPKGLRDALARAEAAEQSLSAMQARVDGLEVALRPLAELDLRPDGFDERPDTQTIYARDNSRITVGDVRRAIAAIAAQRQEKE